MFKIRALLQNITLFSHLLPLLLFFLFLARNKKTEVRVIFFYCLYSFINDYLITFFSSKGKSGDNSILILLSIFTLIEYILFSVALFLIVKKPLFKRIIFLASPFFLAVCTYQFYLNLHTSTIDSISITVEYIFIIAFALLYFFEELNEPSTTFIYSSYKFWMILGILIYSTGTFFFFMQSSDLTDEQWDTWSPINYVFTLIKNILFGVAIIIRKDNVPPDNSFKPPYDELFDKPITPL